MIKKITKNSVLVIVISFLLLPSIFVKAQTTPPTQVPLPIPIISTTPPVQIPLPSSATTPPVQVTLPPPGTNFIPISNSTSNSSTTVTTITTNTATTSSGPNGLVPCTTNCGFNDLLTLINTVVHFILFDLAVPLAAIMFAYAGFLLLFSGGDTGKRGRAKNIFVNVAIGLALAAAAWLIVHTILVLLGYDSSWTTWFGF